jgi:chromosome segregation ATPase
MSCATGNKIPLPCMKTKLLRLLTLTPAIVVLATPFRTAAADAAARASAAVSEVQGDAAKAGLKELDAEIDRLDAIADNAPTAEDKAVAKARIDVLKSRRNDLRKTYVSARFDELKADVKAEGNRVAAWTKRTFNRDPASNAQREIKDTVSDAKRDARQAGDDVYASVNSTAAAVDLAAYKLRPTDTNKDEAKAALKALDARVEALDKQADKMPKGADRDAAKRQVKALEDRKDELKSQFNKARFDALVDDVQSQWGNMVH